MRLFNRMIYICIVILIDRNTKSTNYPKLLFYKIINTRRILKTKWGIRKWKWYVYREGVRSMHVIGKIFFKKRYFENERFLEKGDFWDIMRLFFNMRQFFLPWDILFATQVLLNQNKTFRLNTRLFWEIVEGKLELLEALALACA